MIAGAKIHVIHNEPSWAEPEQLCKQPCAYHDAPHVHRRSWHESPDRDAISAYEKALRRKTIRDTIRESREKVGGVDVQDQ